MRCGFETDQNGSNRVEIPNIVLRRGHDSTTLSPGRYRSRLVTRGLRRGYYFSIFLINRSAWLRAISGM